MQYPRSTGDCARENSNTNRDGTRPAARGGLMRHCPGSHRSGPGISSATAQASPASTRSPCATLSAARCGSGKASTCGRVILPVPARSGKGRLTEWTPAVQPRWREWVKVVESRCGAVAVGRTYLLPPLSFGGASLVRPWLRFHIPLIGRVEDWRAGLGRCRATSPVPSTSNAAGGFPALRSPICFMPRLMGPILLGRLSACRVALDSC